MNCLTAQTMKFSVPMRSFGTLFIKCNDRIIGSHYIGTEKIKLAVSCTSTIVPKEQIVATTKEFLLNWDTQKLSAFQKVCEMDLWQTFFCNSHIQNRGTRELGFKRGDAKTEYWIEVADAVKVAAEWRNSVLVSDSVPFLIENAFQASDLPFNWEKYESRYLQRVSTLKGFGLERKDQLNITGSFDEYNSTEDLTGPLEQSYANLYKLPNLNLNPFIAFNFCNASSLKQLSFLNTRSGDYRLVTLK